MTLTKVDQATRRLRTAARRHEEARHELRKAIEEARKEHTLAEIGGRLGMTRQGVYDLLNR